LKALQNQKKSGSIFFLKIQNEVTTGSSFMEIFQRTSEVAERISKELVIPGRFHCQWKCFELVIPFFVTQFESTNTFNPLCVHVYFPTIVGC
jgi:hypothetical protein